MTQFAEWTPKKRVFTQVKKHTNIHVWQQQPTANKRNKRNTFVS